MNEHEIEQVNIATLSDDQRELLEVYLRGANIPHEFTDHTIAVPEQRARDLYSALAIVVKARADEAQPAGEIDEESTTARPPLIKTPPTIADGRAIASRSRRVIGAFIDWLTLDLWALGAHAAGAPAWATVVTLGIYVVAATAVFGRTIGKWAVGTVVVANRIGDVPGWLRSVLRWLVVSWFSIVSLVLHDLPRGVEIASIAVLIVVYAPVLWDPNRRGWHDRAADTMVVVSKR